MRTQQGKLMIIIKGKLWKNKYFGAKTKFGKSLWLLYSEFEMQLLAAQSIFWGISLKLQIIYK